jgi:hypothetical protein
MEVFNQFKGKKCVTVHYSKVLVLIVPTELEKPNNNFRDNYHKIFHVIPGMKQIAMEEQDISRFELYIDQFEHFFRLFDSLRIGSGLKRDINLLVLVYVLFAFRSKMSKDNAYTVSTSHTNPLQLFLQR